MLLHLPQPPQKKMCKSDNSPALAWAPSPKTLYIRRPLPWPRQGRRLGPPEVWNLLFHGHGPPLVQGRSTNNCLSVFMRFTKPQRRQPLRDSSSAGALTNHSSHSILLFRAFAICPAWHLPPGSKPFKPYRKPVQGNSRSCTPRPSVFKGVQACRLPGPKPFKPFRKPLQGNSRSYTPRPSVFKGVQACRLPGPKPFKPSRRLFEGNSRSYTPRPSVFKGVQACRLPGPKPFKPSASLSKATLAATRHGHLCLRVFKPAVCRPPNPSNPSAGVSKATLAATRHGHPFLRAFKPAVCRAPNPSNPPQAFRRQLSQLHATAICVWGCSSLPFAGLQTLQTLPQAFPRQLSQLHATAICFWGRSSLPFAGPQTLQTLPQAFPRQLSQLHVQKAGNSKSKWCPSWAVLCLHSWARADQHGWVGWLCRSLCRTPPKKEGRRHQSASPFYKTKWGRHQNDQNRHGPKPFCDKLRNFHNDLSCNFLNILAPKCHMSRWR